MIVRLCEIVRWLWGTLMIVRSARASTVWNLGASPLTWKLLHYKLQYFFAITAFLCLLIKVSRLATEEDGDHYDKRHLAGDGVQDESDEEVYYHVIVKENLAHEDEEVDDHVKEHLAHKDEEVDHHVKEHLAHEGAWGVQVDATQLHSTRVWVLQIYLEVLFCSFEGFRCSSHVLRLCREQHKLLFTVGGGGR